MQIPFLSHHLAGSRKAGSTMAFIRSIENSIPACRDARPRDAGVSDDEEHWQKKEARRLARDTAQLSPVTLGARPTSGCCLPTLMTGEISEYPPLHTNMFELAVMFIEMGALLY